MRRASHSALMWRSGVVQLAVEPAGLDGGGMGPVVPGAERVAPELVGRQVGTSEQGLGRHVELMGHRNSGSKLILEGPFGLSGQGTVGTKALERWLWDRHPQSELNIRF